MNHLTAIAKVHEIIGECADNYVINFWLRQIGKTENPELVITNLEKAALASKEFWKWSEKTTPKCVQGSVRYAQNTCYVSVLLGAPLEVEKAEYSAKLMESLTTINSAFKNLNKLDSLSLA